MLVSNLTGCASFDFGLGKREKPIEITTKAADKTPLAMTLPDPLKLEPLQWVIITPANQEAVFAKIEASNQDPAVFALTPDGYKSLAVTIGELRNLINTQRNIIIKYQQYYEPVKPVESK